MAESGHTGAINVGVAGNGHGEVAVSVEDSAREFARTRPSAFSIRSTRPRGRTGCRPFDLPRHRRGAWRTPVARAERGRRKHLPVHAARDESVADRSPRAFGLRPRAITPRASLDCRAASFDLVEPLRRSHQPPRDSKLASRSSTRLSRNARARDVHGGKHRAPPRRTRRNGATRRGPCGRGRDTELGGAHCSSGCHSLSWSICQPPAISISASRAISACKPGAHRRATGRARRRRAISMRSRGIHQRSSAKASSRRCATAGGTIIGRCPSSMARATNSLGRCRRRGPRGRASTRCPAPTAPRRRRFETCSEPARRSAQVSACLCRHRAATGPSPCINASFDVEISGVSPRRSRSWRRRA